LPIGDWSIRNTFFTYSKHIMVAAWSLVVFAAYSEIIQSYIPSRTTDIRDLFNDCIGITIALLIFALLHKNKTIEATPAAPTKKMPVKASRKKKAIRKKLVAIPS
ncbi:MAG: VanZ family protein, partial [Patescibacteria group bacterium]